MAGDLRLALSQYFNKETNAHFIIADQIEQSEPRLIS